ncbi:GIY-YIG nuclease family protein [Candidatus Saccharibacteria bacterium]|nr:GIY-YIG nuclease family protein [Candidatus Saccharibacteria bacterium]
MDLKAKLKTLPSSPGVYFHKDQSGQIIYVGKAAVLKNRVRQYFQNTEKDPKTAALVAEIADTDWIVVDTEMDALFLESEMIKRYKPKWNILLRDDKTVCYVRIDMKSEVPFVTTTRQPMDDQATYVGPFYAKNTIMTALRILRKIFPYYDKPYTGKKTLNTDLGLTPGIEIGKTTPVAYKKDLRKLIRYLEGDREKLIKDIEKEMNTESKLGHYERAAELRNQFFGLKGLKKKIVFSNKEFLDISKDRALAELTQLLNLENPPRRIEGYDISHNQGENVVASMVVFVNGVSDRSEYRKFKLKQQKNDDFNNLREVLERRLKHKEWPLPDLIILDGGEPQLRAVQDIVDAAHIPIIGRDKSGDHSKNAEVKIVVPAAVAPDVATATPASDATAYRLVYFAPDSHLAKLIARIDEEAHRFAITYHRLLQNKNMLK